MQHGKWRTEYATECGHEVYLLDDWETPKFCKECKAEYDSQFYDKDCEGCGASMRVSSRWERIPKFCKECKARFEAKQYEKPCEHCGTPMRANRDWEHPPKFCSNCKSRFAPSTPTATTVVTLSRSKWVRRSSVTKMDGSFQGSARSAESYSVTSHSGLFGRRPYLEEWSFGRTTAWDNSSLNRETKRRSSMIAGVTQVKLERP